MADIFKRLFSLIMAAVTIAALSAYLCTPAYADSSNTFTLEKGGTVYGLCQRQGVDYYDNLELILKLNGFTKESQLTRLPVGSEIVLPSSSDSGNTPALISGDSVAFYLMPFLFNEGDTICEVYHLWGLRFETYADVIRSVNHKENLDLIWVGELLYLPVDAANLMGNDYTTVVSHCMKSGETAYDVCKSYDMDFDKIEDDLQEYNPGVELTKLKKGQTLYLPLL